MSPTYEKKIEGKEKKNYDLIQLESRAQSEGNLTPSTLSQLVGSH